MNASKNLLFIVIVMFLLVSCGKKGSPGPTNTKTDVYVIGTELRGNYNNPVAVYWKNGVKVVLGDTLIQGIKSAANAITVSDTDVYIAGSVNYHAVYWKNGKRIVLQGGVASDATAITIVGTDVYVAGMNEFNAGGMEPVYWKNGVPILLDDGGGPAYTSATAIAVAGNNVYVAGYSETYKVDKSNLNAYPNAVFWNNGVLSVLGPSVSTSSSFAPPGSSNEGWVNIAVSGTDVYVTGAFTSTGTAYWKNGTVVALENNTTPFYSLLNNVAIIGSDVYAVGLGNFHPAYWKNGVETILTGDLSDPANGITVSGSDIYVSGNTASGPVYWKNGTLVQLGKYPLLADGIAVVSH